MSFTPLIGHHWALEYLHRQQKGGLLRHSYLIVGPQQIGKTRLALTFAMALNCLVSTGAMPCGECDSCRRILRGTHPDVTAISPNGSTFTIEQVRDLEEELPLSPMRSDSKIRILTDFDLASREAQNALLKTLEEPPTHVLLFLTASEIDALAPTIVSRCQVISLRPVPEEEIATSLAKTGVPLSEAQFLAAQSGGRPGWALAALEDNDMRDRRSQALAQVASLLSLRRADRLRYADNLAKQERARVLETLQTWKIWWHDLLLKSTGARSGYLLADQERLEAIPAVSNAQAARFLRELADIEAKIQRNVNVRLALSVLVLHMPHIPQTTNAEIRAE